MKVGHVETTVTTVFNVIDEEGNTLQMEVFNGTEIPELRFKGNLSETKFKTVLTELSKKREELLKRYQENEDKTSPKE